MPPNTVFVGRPSIFGNPFGSEGTISSARSVVESYRRLFEQKPSLRRHGILRIAKGNSGRGEARVDRMKSELHRLRGKNLACWCPLDQPCHADVLLELANR